MGKQVLGDFPLPEEGDIIDSIIREEAARAKPKAPVRSNEVEEIKRGVDLVNLFATFGVTLKPRGKRHEGICPWHPDKKTPSLSVDRVKGLYHCFGCQAKGDAITLVQKMKACDFKEALAYLRRAAGGRPFAPAAAAPTTKQAEQTVVKAKAFFKELKAEGPTENILDGQAAGEKQPPREEPLTPAQPELTLATITDYYHKKLLKSPAALAYLKKRGLINPEVYSRFNLGYADGSLCSKLTDGQREHLKALGILNAGGYEHFKGYLTVPLRDEAGRVVGMYGRHITSEEASKKHRYLPGGHKGLLNGKAARVYEELVLTESIIDALSLISLSIENVIPLYGTSGFTDDHLAAFKEHRVKTIVIALDNDEPGQAATAKLKEELLSQGYNIKTIFPSAVKDWNDYLTGGGSGEAVKQAIADAPLMLSKTKAKEFSVNYCGGRYEFSFGELTYRITGVKEGFVGNLKVTMHVSYQDQRDIDHLDLYSARSRTGFAVKVALLTGFPEERIERELLTIVDYLEEEREKKLNARLPTGPYRMSAEEEQLGLALLSSPDLFSRIVGDMEALGYVGEEVNKKLIYLAASSRKLDDPLSVIILSESAAGKSYLVDTVKKLLPPEDVLSLTSLSDQALNYLEADELKHKFLVMGEAVHGEVVEHQLREMLSSKELARLVTLKDEQTGEMVSKLIRKEVIVSCVMSSTDYELNAENLSRSFVINTDESVEQTRRIHSQQRKKYSLSRYEEKTHNIPQLIRAHQAAQRLLKKRVIVNPYAESLKFPDQLLRSRRDHERFMDLIACVCFLRQYQKAEQETEAGLKYITCDREDLNIAIELATSILATTLTAFPKSAQLLYEAVRALLAEKAQAEGLSVTEVKVTQREVRERYGYPQMFVKRGLYLLCEYEFLRAGGVEARGSRRTYRLVKDSPLDLVDLSMLKLPV